MMMAEGFLLYWTRTGLNPHGIEPTRDWTRTGLIPHGIEPTFLKLESWSPGVGFILIITYNVLNKIKKERM